MKIVARTKPSQYEQNDDPEVYVVIQGQPEFINMNCSQTYNFNSQDEMFSG